MNHKDIIENLKYYLSESLHITEANLYKLSLSSIQELKTEIEYSQLRINRCKKDLAIITKTSYKIHKFLNSDELSFIDLRSRINDRMLEVQRELLWIAMCEEVIEYKRSSVYEI